MRLSAVFSLTAGLFSCASVAAPLDDLSSLSLFEARTDDGYVSSGAMALRKDYLKYGVTLPSSLVKRATINSTVTATPTEYDVTYLVSAAVGSPSATAITASLDTSSGTCTFYAPKLGTSGTTSTTVKVGAVSVKGQSVTLSSDSSGGSNAIGMSPPTTIYGGGVASFYANAVSEGLIAPVFTANLKKGAPGTYGLGFIDTTAYSGSITYATVDGSQGFWQFNASGYAIGTGSFVSSTISSVVDTGTTLVYLPQAVVKAYYAQVPGSVSSASAGGWTVPCSSTLPNFTVGIGSYKAVIPGSYINYSPISSGSSTCYGGLQPNTDIGFSVLGLVFIKSQFVVFKGSCSWKSDTTRRDWLR